MSFFSKVLHLGTFGLLFFSILGCGKEDPRFIGSWKFIKGTNPTKAPITLHIKPNQILTFSANETTTHSGTWMKVSDQSFKAQVKNSIASGNSFIIPIEYSGVIEKGLLKLTLPKGETQYFAFFNSSQ